MRRRSCVRALLLEKSDIEILVAPAHAIEAEVFFREPAGVVCPVAREDAASDKKAADGVGKVVFIARGNQAPRWSLTNSELPPTL